MRLAQNLLGRAGSGLRVLLYAAAEMPVALLQTLEVLEQVLQILLEFVVGLLDLLVVMEVHFALPIALLGLLVGIVPFEGLGGDEVVQFGGLELQPRKFLFLLHKILPKRFGKGLQGHSHLGHHVSLLTLFRQLAFRLLDLALEVHAVVLQV